MTHDEMLDAVDRQIIIAPPFALGGYTRFLQALRAVVELHKPKQNGDCSKCVFMIDPMGKYEMYPYPCPTIQAIEKELF